MHVDDVFGGMGLREVFVSGVRLLEDGVDICGVFHKQGERTGDWSKAVLLAGLHNSGGAGLDGDHTVGMVHEGNSSGGGGKAEQTGDVGECFCEDNFGIEPGI